MLHYKSSGRVWVLPLLCPVQAVAPPLDPPGSILRRTVTVHLSRCHPTNQDSQHVLHVAKILSGSFTSFLFRPLHRLPSIMDSTQPPTHLTLIFRVFLSSSRGALSRTSYKCPVSSAVPVTPCVIIPHQSRIPHPPSFSSSLCVPVHPFPT